MGITVAHSFTFLLFYVRTMPRNPLSPMPVIAVVHCWFFRSCGHTYARGKHL